MLYPGNYETFRRLRAAARDEARPAEVRAEPAEKKKASVAPKARRLPRNEEQELSKLPDQIELAEAALSRCQASLADPAAHAAGRENVQRLTAELAGAEAEVLRLMTRWEELEQKRAELAAEGNASS
ncbi:MAG: hypothetical protein QM756_32520 [Polyangiaceae bacterium]